MYLKMKVKELQIQMIKNTLENPLGRHHVGDHISQQVQ